MQDGKALQAGTSHFLGQNFAKAFDVKFATAEGKQEYVWGTSWGVSTRLMGALVMTHSDDNGLVLPPNLAPIQVVIVPIYKSDEELEKITSVVTDLMTQFKKLKISVKFDNRTTQKPGFKFAEWELKGVPVRIAVGPKDLENGTFEVARRDTLSKEVVSKDGIVNYINDLLETIQNDLFQRALDYRQNHITEVNSFEEFKEVLENKGGFLSAHWDGTPETEEKIIFHSIKQMEKQILHKIGVLYGKDVQRDYSYEVDHPANKVRIIKYILEYINIERETLLKIIDETYNKIKIK
jgi:prolyl-tRNA synthetase